MNLLAFNRRRSTTSGFSLVEVVVATAVFATAIVAIIGLMSPLSKRVDNVASSMTAERLAEGIQEELNRIGWAYATGSWFQTRLHPNAQPPLQLVATPSGDRVRLLLVDAGIPPADNDLNHPVLPGIAERDRYFLITLSRVRDFNDDVSSSLPIRAEVAWPYQVPVGPASGTFAAYGSSADPFESPPVSSRTVMTYYFTLRP